MAQETNELENWKDEVPMVNPSSDSEFDVWNEGVPNEDRDEGFGAPVRRRVVIF